MPYQYYCPCSQQKLLEGLEATAGQPVQCPFCPQVFVQPHPPAAAPMAAPPGYGAPSPAPQYGGTVPGGPMPGGYPGPAMPSGPAQGGYAPGVPMPGYSPAGPMPGYAPGPMPGGQMPGVPMPGGPMPGAYGAPAPAYGPAPSFAPNAAGPFGPAPQNPGFGAPVEAPIDFTGGSQAREELLHIPCPNQECPYHTQPMEVPSEMVGQDVQCPGCYTALTLRYEDSVQFKTRRDEFIARKEEKFARNALNWAITAVVIVLCLLAFMLFATAK